MIGVGFKKLASTHVSKLPPSHPPPPHELISQNRFGMLVFKNNDRSRNVHTHVHFHAYRREKLIARAFAARIMAHKPPF